MILVLMMAFTLLILYRHWKRRKLLASVASQGNQTGNNAGSGGSSGLLITPTTGLPATANSTITNSSQPFTAATNYGGYVG